MVTLLNQYQLGDMQIYYYLDSENRNVECMLLPCGTEPISWEKKNQNIDSLVQVKVVGDTYQGGYAGGNTMRQSESTTNFQYDTQTVTEEAAGKTICTRLKDGRGLEVMHYFVWKKNAESIESYVTIQNHLNEKVTLESLSSFSLGGISPLLEGDGCNQIKVHRMRSVWSMEGRLDTQYLEDLQLEPSWAGHAVRAERFGQAGSMAVNRFFPYLVIEDEKNEVFWGAQLAHNASWQMEIYRKDDGVAISGGLADREFGHWMKDLGTGELFETPHAIVSVCKGGGVDRISQCMTLALQSVVEQGPESEQHLPIIFNEYCTTWGCPSHENISQILSAIKGKGFEYFVIDCGWYKENGIPWDIAMGDYEVSKELFPEGLDKTVSAIREMGMKPGIWFEIENVGKAAKAYQLEEHLLQRDGHTLTTTMRRFWDMRDPWVMNYLTDKVIGTLQKYQFEYMKIDYNDTTGIGCDGAESLGEGLRQNMAAAMNFIHKVKREVPGIILENCASGGHRLEPLMMSESSMASFSDAHECEEIPIIAANLHRVILPRQSQIWAVIRKEDSLKRIAYSVANTFLGRMCISGDVLELTDKQWDVLDRGIDFYKKIAPIIKDGYTYRYGNEIRSYRHPEGWQGIVRVGKQGDAFLVLHVFHGVVEKNLNIRIPLPPDTSYEIESMYSDDDAMVQLENNSISYQPVEDMKAIAVYVKPKLLS